MGLHELQVEPAEPSNETPAASSSAPAADVLPPPQPQQRNVQTPKSGMFNMPPINVQELAATQHAMKRFISKSYPTAPKPLQPDTGAEEPALAQQQQPQQPGYNTIVLDEDAEEDQPLEPPTRCGTLLQLLQLALCLRVVTVGSSSTTTNTGNGGTQAQGGAAFDIVVMCHLGELRLREVDFVEDGCDGCFISQAPPGSGSTGVPFTPT